MSNLFDSIKVRRPKRNLFDLSHEVKLTTNFGRLTPICCIDCVPGDTIKIRTEQLVRFAPMLAPIMHRVNCYVHYFFVPHRLVWDDFENFITGGSDGKFDAVFPRFQFRTSSETLPPYFRKSSLADYLGVPVPEKGPCPNPIEFSALPFRSYQMIWNEYYRDQNLQDPVEITKGSGYDGNLNLLGLQYRAWEKDYFTSALPFAQRGADVTIPVLNTENPIDVYLNKKGSFPYFVNSVGQKPSWSDGQQILMNGDSAPGSSSYDGNVSVGRLDSGEPVVDGSFPSMYFDPNGSLSIDPMKFASSVTINELRASIKLQEWLEATARGGSRYIEQIASLFGVKSSDARLQRPEFIGGGKAPIVVSEVLQTSSTDSESPQGNMAGRAVSAGASHFFSKFCEEHGYIIGIMSVVPKPSYQQGLPRHFTRWDKFDFFYPQFAHLGEQEIKNKELYFSFREDGEVNEGTFGYTPRYSEYKYIPSSVHGDFRDNLNFWHLGRIFTSPPTLSGQFVEIDDNSLNRIFAVTDGSDKLWIQVFNYIRALRPMPKYGTPYI